MSALPASAAMAALLCVVEADAVALPGACGSRLWRLPLSRRSRRGSARQSQRLEARRARRCLAGRGGGFARARARGAPARLRR
jgi:hypothetical protein